MNNASGMDVLDGQHDRADELGCIGLVVVALCTDAVKQLAACAQVEHEVQVVRCLEIVVQCDDVLVAAGDLLQDGDLIPDLRARSLAGAREMKRGSNHVLTALHKLLVDDLAGIVLAGLDVDGLLYDGIGAASKRLACAILRRS